MTASELKAWLETDDSKNTGWHGEGGNAEDVEAVGHQSGRHIVEILERNPDRNADKFTEDDLKHMRKVVAYK